MMSCQILRYKINDNERHEHCLRLVMKSEPALKEADYGNLSMRASIDWTAR